MVMKFVAAVALIEEVMPYAQNASSGSSKNAHAFFSCLMSDEIRHFVTHLICFTLFVKYEKKEKSEI